jgi:hypothetical protein
MDHMFHCFWGRNKKGNEGFKSSWTIEEEGKE